MAEFLADLVATFIVVFVIIDPFASLPSFITLTRSFTDEQRKMAANNSVFISGVLAILFLFAGPLILKVLGVTLGDFRIAGGIVLGLLGMETVLGFSLSNNKEKDEQLDAVIVLIATPLLTGPGLLSSLILLQGQYGYLVPLIAMLLALLVTWFILRNANFVNRIAGKHIIDISSKVMGLLLLTIAIAFIRSGLIG